MIEGRPIRVAAIAATAVIALMGVVIARTFFHGPTVVPLDQGEAALKAGGHPDYTLTIVPRANHGLFEDKTGGSAERAGLQRIAPAYFTTVQDWLARRIPGFAASPIR